MASAVPVIVSACSGAADFVGDGGIILQDPNDVGQLANAMIKLGSNPKIRAKMAAAGRTRAQEMQWSVMADEYLRVFEETCVARDQISRSA
jgi:UDP-glucose:(heptosyl)LPS alpha-1,3-glucosyltransferase